MALTHAQARRLVERLYLIGPSHGTIAGDFDRVRDAFERHPQLPAALNALDPGKMEETPQGAAAHLGCREILTYMLAQGVALDPFIACALGMRDVLEQFLRREPHLANSRGAHGIHALNHALDRSTFELLLEHGADPSALVYAPWGWTPLHEEAHRGRQDRVELLIAAGAKPDAGGAGTTPLHAAARMGHRDVVEWLVQRGANVNARGSGGPWQGKSVLSIALGNGHLEIAAFLAQHGATAELPY
jgi:ankyrin repeat protein